MINQYRWTAICAYPDKGEFMFYSPAFTVSKWSDLDSVAEAEVKAAWSRVSPHEPPAIVRLESGYLGFVAEEVV
jgi:hypothetical protein